jgi:hypothetical protein
MRRPSFPIRLFRFMRAKRERREFSLIERRYQDRISVLQERAEGDANRIKSLSEELEVAQMTLRVQSKTVDQLALALARDRERLEQEIASLSAPKSGPASFQMPSQGGPNLNVA